MLKKTKKSYSTFLFFLVFIIALAAYSAAAAADLDTVTLTRPGDAVVVDKAPNGIFIKDRNSPPLTFLLVTGSSTIRGPEGKPLSFKNLPIPCRASVVSRRYKNKHFPVLVTLDVQHYGRNAQKGFTMKEKFRYRPH